MKRNLTKALFKKGLDPKTKIYFYFIFHKARGPRG